MKKGFLLVCLSISSLCSFAQRNADLALTMSSPSSSAPVVGSSAFNFTATITNNGPDVIKTTDTLVIAFLLDNGTSPVSFIYSGQTYSSLASVFSSQLASGASGNINVSIALATFPGTGTHSFCAVALALNRSHDSVHDAQPANNKACANVTVQNATSVPVISGDYGSVTVYPNPAISAANIKLELPADEEVNILLEDMYGRTVYSIPKGTVQAGTSTVHLDTQNLPAGTYIYNVQTGSGTNRGRLVVAH